MSSHDHTYCRKHKRRHAKPLHQSAKRRKRGTVQEEELQKLEDRYVVNTVVRPEIHQKPASSAATAPAVSSIDLMIHGLSSPAYQRVYHSVVDPMLVTSTKTPGWYSLELGCRIKQRLWETLTCPSFIEESQVQESEQIHYIEKFNTSTLKSFAPHFDVDIS